MANPLAYLGSMFTAGTPVELIIKDRDPTQTDRSYVLGQMWLNKGTQNTFILQGFNADGAVWEVVENPKGNFTAVVAPSVGDDISAGYGVGSTWVDTATGFYYVCTSNALGAAVWTNLSSGGGGGLPVIGSSTDNALVRWDGVAGNAVQNSGATLSDAGVLSLAQPLAVTSGGTGVTAHTSGGILLGNGAGAIVATGQPVNGQVLIGSTGLSPVLGTLTAGSNIAITNGAGSITIAATGISGGDVVGPASSVDTRVALFDGITGKLIKQSAGVTIDASSNVSGVNNLTVGGAFVLSADQVQVSEGGTGATSFTQNGLLVGNGTSAVGSTAALADGQLLIGSFGNAPVAANLTAGTNISITNSAGGITINSTASGGLTFQAVSGTSQAMAVNTAYQNDNAGVTTFTLPVTAAKGSRQEIIGYGVGGWILAQNASQSVIIGNVQTTVGVGGSLASSNRYDNVELVCVVANTTWKVVDMQGNLNYV